MRWSKLFVPTTRDVPAGADAVSHQLLLRAGYIRQVTAGVYALLPLAQRMRLKIMQIIREEMNAIGGQEFMLSALQPAELWKESGRWQSLDEIMFRLRDRKNAEMALGLTHEEAFTSLARTGLQSYRQLPQIWYQMQTKFRDEARPKSGLLRVREFTMKDAYSFDMDSEGLDRAFAAHYEAYKKIFIRCGLKFTAVDASSGAMGGSQSTEFMVLTEAGEDEVAICAECGYAANTEKAISQVPTHKTREGAPSELERFDTPNIKTIEQLANFPGGAPADGQIKTLVYVLDDSQSLTLILMRGDHELNETKLLAATGAQAARPAMEDEIVKALGAKPGSLGAVGIQSGAAGPIARILADSSLEGRTEMVTGANQDDIHLRGVNVARDIAVDLWSDLRLVGDGELCASCSGTLHIHKALEIGHIFKLGTRYSETMGAHVLDSQGSRVPIVMGSYGIGVERMMAAIAELSHDKAGLVWPLAVAPFQVIVLPTNTSDEAIMSAAEDIYRKLQTAGVDTILDDRDERAGVKFNDADLVGIPLRITLGKKIKDGLVEVKGRLESESVDVSLDNLVHFVREKIDKMST
ncbi:MAG: proline--tRNA ligase [Cyanobacteria bacterium SZAS TMP-1]|nr:proline--tRNA ligase [Cyanobacteria bacterium SZAS TMP-1]